jgi:enhancing lycopene biosynthesis protein 2
MVESKVRVAVVLSGCGHLDGSEITEAVATLYHLASRGATYECFAPDRDLDEIDHRTGQPTGQRRKVLRESARLARGQIRSLGELDAAQFDALAFPGGFGAAKNLSDFASKGGAATALPEVVKVVKAFVDARKPIGAMCIAPAMLAAALKDTKVHPLVTVGAASGASAGVVALGARHQASPVEGFVVDRENRIVSTPAYMYDAPITGVFEGIGKLVQTLVGLARER